LAGSTAGSIYLLGQLHGLDAIVHLQRTVLPSEQAAKVVKNGLESLNVFLDNRPVRLYVTIQEFVGRRG
jgi:hypothetical protein